MKKIALILLIILGLLPIIRLSEDGPSSILIFSLFVLVFLWKGLRKASAKIAIPLGPYYIILGTILGGITQAIVQIEGFEKSFSTDPVVHFFQALTIYICVTVAWYYFLKKYAFSVWEIFCLTGVWGVLMEAILIYGSFNPLVWLFIFLVYGPFGTIPYLLTKDKFKANRVEPNSKNYLRALILLTCALLAAKALIALLAILGIK